MRFALNLPADELADWDAGDRLRIVRRVIRQGDLPGMYDVELEVERITDDRHPEMNIDRNWFLP